MIGVHIGTDADGNRPYRNPGGALLNYLDTTFGGQKAAAQFVAGGALERHPDLRVLISEGGATWAPFVGDRLNEAYRQHPMFDDGRLPKPPKEYIMEQVYASFQHDETAVPAYTGMGFPTSCSAPTTRTSRARTRTPRRCCTRSSTVSTTT